MTTIPQVSQAMQEVLTSTAEAAGAAVYFTRRADNAKFTASTLTQTLVLGYLAHPNASAAQLAQSAARVGVDVSQQAIRDRMNSRTAALLQAVLTMSVQHLVASDEPVAIPILQRFAGVSIHDGTTIPLPEELSALWPGCGGDGPNAALKCGVQIDMLHGALTALDIASGRTSDYVLPCQHRVLPVGSLRLADLGFFDLEVLRQHDDDGSYFLSKTRVNTIIGDDQGKEWSLWAFIQHLGVVQTWDGWVTVGHEGVRARLLVQAVPQEVADQRRRRIRKEARDKGRTPSAAALALAAWTILITNAPPELLSLAEALVVAKVRWQIELLFKLWKSHGRLGRADAPHAWYQLCTVYAQLIAMLLQHWVIVVSCWRYPDHSLVKAAQVVRDHATVLASARGRAERLAEALETIQTIVIRAARLNPRKKRPNTYQLLLALTTPEEGDVPDFNY
jgi:hypothetical protein